MMDAISAGAMWEPTPDMEQVTILSQQSAVQGSFQAWLLPYARRRKLNKQEQLRHGLVGTQMIVWEVWQYSLNIAVPTQTPPNTGSAPPSTQSVGPAPNPKMRDRILATKDNTTWVIAEGGVSQDFIGTLWVLVCQLTTGPNP